MKVAVTDSDDDESKDSELKGTSVCITGADFLGRKSAGAKILLQHLLDLCDRWVGGSCDLVGQSLQVLLPVHVVIKLCDRQFDCAWHHVCSIHRHSPAGNLASQYEPNDRVKRTFLDANQFLCNPSTINRQIMWMGGGGGGKGGYAVS